MYPFALKSEAFPRYSQDGELLEMEQFEYLESEVNRNNPDYIRWVQGSLNKVLGLRLVVDGKIGPATRSAIRSFQQRQGLRVDGIVRPKTEAALRAALGGQGLPQTTPPLPGGDVGATSGRPEVLDRFEYNKDALRPFHQAQIEKIAQQIVASQSTSQPIRSVRIIGHTDPAGPDWYNIQLGQRRANQARSALIRAIEKLQPGLASAINYKVESFGEVRPTGMGPERDRRVQIYLPVTIPSINVEKQVDDVLRYIQDEARKAAKRPKTVASSNFARIVRSRYLKSYLAAPTPATGTLAINNISMQGTGDFVTNHCTQGNCKVQNVPCDNRTIPAECDNWECAIPYFNMPLAPLLSRVSGLQWLPANYGGAATDILRVANRRTLDHIDVDFLLGGKRVLDMLKCETRKRQGQGLDTDLAANDVKNESQLMHWATGVKYSHLGTDRLRELFIAYELLHLEQWDVFGIDPINDLIAEDAGRHMAWEIRFLRMRDQNFISVLDQGFAQARAWVGSLLRLRRSELDRQIKADAPPPYLYHWTQPVPPTHYTHPYQLPSIRQMLVSGKSIEEVKASALVARYIEVYTLVFEADLWEKRYGQVRVSTLQRAMALGQLNSVFRALALAEQGQPTSRRSRSAVRFALLAPKLYRTVSRSPGRILTRRTGLIPSRV